MTSIFENILFFIQLFKLTQNASIVSNKYHVVTYDQDWRNKHFCFSQCTKLLFVLSLIIMKWIDSWLLMLEYNSVQISSKQTFSQVPTQPHTSWSAPVFHLNHTHLEVTFHCVSLIVPCEPSILDNQVFCTATFVVLSSNFCMLSALLLLHGFCHFWA